MKRFLMLVGVAAVAASMYVAASPASQQSTGPTAKQFNALKKQVATLNKKLKLVKSEADAAVTLIGDCYLVINGNSVGFATLPVTQFGVSGPGFLFGTDSGSATPRTALDVNTGSTPDAYLQAINPSCFASALRHGAVRSASNRVQHWAERNR